MALRWSVRRNTYHDSVKLMRVSEALQAEPEVRRAAAVMATPLNVELLGDDGLLPDGLSAAPDDLVVAIDAESPDAADRALARVESLLAPALDTHVERDVPARTLEAAAGKRGANMAVIAVPGRFAATEAYAALHAGLHVFLFSDNVSLEDEVRLKQLADERDLLMMGPDCGTAVISGVGLGFANRVDRGPVGIVGASGTGIQQVCCLLDAAGVGVAQAIGTGGRDLSSAVGGSMTLRGLRLLADDPAVEVIVVISKPADAGAAERLHRAMAAVGKPVVACLLGTQRADEGPVRYAGTLLDAAQQACARLGTRLDRESSTVEARLASAPRRGRVYGLFAGGTLCSEARQILDVRGVSHELVDLGDDEFTRGRAHPIIDPRLRNSMLPGLAGREDVGAIFLDVILGDLADPDPAGTLAPIIETLCVRHSIPVVVTLIGAGRDPQGLEQQRRALSDAGAFVFAANAVAAEAAAQVVGGTP